MCRVCSVVIVLIDATIGSKTAELSVEAFANYIYLLLVPAI